MLDEVRLIRAAHPATNILIYTEYADSQAAAVQRTALARSARCWRSAVSIQQRERTRIAERCAEHDGIILVSTDSMAEGLNLHQRCFHLIHLDLPYNPNRLEQRNGRIDRYGQEHDPEIRYLYLAGTFEERLLLRLIAKYEKARARLTFMPDTLGVTADEEAWSTGLVAGFAEDRRPCSRMSRSDPHPRPGCGNGQSGCVSRSAARDRSRVRRSRTPVGPPWLAGGARAERRPSQSLAASSAQTAQRCLARPYRSAGFRRCGDRGRNRWRACRSSVLRLPADWSAGLDDLPGFDAQTQHAAHHARPRPASRQEGTFAGSSGPCTSAGAARDLRVHGGLPEGTWDNRVSVALADEGAPLAVLLTYRAEMRSSAPRRVAADLRGAVASARTAVEIAEPECWLRLAASSIEPLARRTSGNTCSHPGCQAAGRRPRRSPMLSMHRETVQVAADHQQRSRTRGERPASLAAQARRRYLRRFRASDGRPVWYCRSWPSWKLLPLPLDRLAAFAADDNNPPARRREANSVVALYPAPNYGAGSAGGIVAAGSAADRHADAGAASAARVTLDLHDCTFTGPALPEPFVRLRIGWATDQVGLLPNTRTSLSSRTGTRCAGNSRTRAVAGSSSRHNHIIAPLAHTSRLTIAPQRQEDEVSTREGLEDGGWLMQAP